MKRMVEIIVCFLCASAVQSHLIKYLNSSFSAINDLPISQNHTRKFLELCFSNRMNPVAISNDLVRIFHGITDNGGRNISVITIDEKLNWRRYNDSNLLVYPSYVTIILTANYTKGHSSKCFPFKISYFRQELEVLNYWSSTTLFLVAGNQCGDVSTALGRLWEIQALISYFLCPNEFNNNTMIYTMNPFGDRAPEPWEKVEIPDKPCDVCTFYRMSFINDAGICPSVTFDKTEFLNGYELGEWSNGMRHLRKSKYFYENLWSAMNITPVECYGVAIREHLYTVATDPVPFHNSIEEFYDIIPYFEQGGYVIVTQKQSFVPTLNQVIDSFYSGKNNLVIDYSNSYFLMMFLNNRYDFGATILDLLAFLLDMGISTPILRLSMRITFMSATLFALIFNPVLQGQVTSLLSRPGHRNVQSLRDLIDHNYRVYFRSKEITKKLRENQLWDDENYFSQFYNMISKKQDQDACLTYVRNDSSAACIVDYTELEHIDENLHYSSEFAPKYQVFQIFKHFPLNEKINKIALKLFETGHLSYAERHEFHKILLERKRKIERIKALMKYNQLDLEDFGLVYISITLASAWAIIIFGIEVLINKILTFLDKRAKKLEMRKLMIRETIASTVRRIAILTEQL